MTTVQTIRQFNQIAISYKLTGLAMQLWYTVYDCISQNRQDVHIPSCQLADTLHTGSRQLLRARNALTEAGCLIVRKQGGQTYYSIPLMDPDPKADNPETADRKTAAPEALRTDASTDARRTRKTTAPAKPAGTVRTYRPHMPKLPDIIMNRAYRSLLPDAVAQLGIDDVHMQRKILRKLEAWCDMRHTYGWTLTADGLNVSLENLRTHSGGDTAQMERIIDRTIRRKWKGFHPYIVDAVRPDRTERTTAEALPRRNSKGLPAYDTQKLKEEDFAFLEL